MRHHIVMFQCDGRECDTEAQYSGPTEKAALDAAWRAGWTPMTKTKDACPQCLKKIQGHNYRKALKRAELLDS